ncbi:MAG TPA: tagatose-bisphosphate aldolase [Clostridiales bacterium]|nr:tagatose-bisphosphate aldolase [Clostridiales bacterium]
MKYGLKEILDIAEEGKFAIPSFNVYNLEMLMGIMRAVKETKAPVIIQMYSRLFDTETGKRLAPAIREAMEEVNTPVAFHLDHGAGEKEVLNAFRMGATGVMIDASNKPLNENIAITKRVVEMAKHIGVGVEGELGHIGSVNDEKWDAYTEVSDAVKYTEETGIDALAIMVGTAHGKYKKAPVLYIDRIAEIHGAVKVHLVLHGGSGVPDDQIKSAIKAGVRKINIATDLCYAFVNGLVDPLSKPLDLSLSAAADSVKEVAIDRIKVFGADKYMG